MDIDEAAYDVCRGWYDFESTNGPCVNLAYDFSDSLLRGGIMNGMGRTDTLYGFGAPR